MHSTLILSLALTISAPATKEEAGKAASLLGEWTGVKATLGGNDLPTPEGGISLTFTADGKLFVREGNAKEPEPGTYTLGGKKTPAEIDLTPPESKKGIGKMVGIYKVDGDMLTLCVGIGPEPVRPDKFESPEGKPIMLMTLKRAKK